MVIPFASSTEHLFAELERIDLLIQMQVLRARQLNAVDNAFQGLVITESEVDALLAAPAGLPAWAAVSDPWRPEQVETAMAARALESSRRQVVSTGKGIVLRLARLAALFELAPFDVDALLICLAPELDLRYQRLYAYLQDDVTKKHPSVDLVLNLLCLTLAAKLTDRQRFLPDAPLFRHGVLHLFDDPVQSQQPLLGKYLRVDERIVAYLLGSEMTASSLPSYCRWVVPQACLNDMLMPENVRQRLTLLVQDARANGQDIVAYFQGLPGVGKQTAAEAICHEIGLSLLVVDGEKLLITEVGRVAEAVHAAGREAALHGAAFYWEGWDALLHPPDGDAAQGGRFTWSDWFGALVSRPRLIFLAGRTAWEPAGAVLDARFVRAEFALPDYGERLNLWRRSLNGSAPPDHLDLAALAGKFRLSGGQIRDAAATARNLARWRDPAAGQVTGADLHAASRLHSSHNLASLARKITPHYTWNDIILPPDRLEQLLEICNQAKHRARVYDAWGFDHKLALGKGLNVLFAGPSGTGKTMAAEIIANELGLELYKIDLSSVISKYIGETEKNLARIFAEAETSNAILFFDEADALFGKRSEVRDSHDRYANIEISYLLQRMEEYDGAVILATNLARNMDDAFVRRLHFVVDFPFPDADQRLQIWEQIWPGETPRDLELDLSFMAGRFDLAGGNIRNIALAAAFLAVDDDEVQMPHLIRATRREYQKMGRLMREADFGVYARYLT